MLKIPKNTPLKTGCFCCVFFIAALQNRQLCFSDGLSKYQIIAS